VIEEIFIFLCSSLKAEDKLKTKCEHCHKMTEHYIDEVNSFFVYIILGLICHRCGTKKQSIFTEVSDEIKKEILEKQKPSSHNK
jgi:hypothetical protein